MTQSAKDLENTFERALDLLVHNWIILVPGFVLAIVGAVLAALFVAFVGSVALSGNGTPEAAAFISGVSSVGVFLIASGVAMVQMAFVTGMAASAWRDGHATLGHGWQTLRKRVLSVIPAVLLLWFLGFCAAVLAAPTFLVTVVIYVVFFIYTVASVVIGERGAVAALIESAQIAAGNLLPTVAMVAIIGLVALAGGWLGNLIAQYWAFAGWLVSEVSSQLTVAYLTLVVVGEYLKLTSPEVGS